MIDPHLAVLHDLMETVDVEDMLLLLSELSSKTNVLDGVDAGLVAAQLREILASAVDARVKAAQAMEKLSAREREVAALLAQGRSNADIAKALGCTERTVRAHMESMNRKVGVSNRTALLAILSGAVLAFPPI